MSAIPSGVSPTKLTVDRAAHRIVFERTFAATCDEVFAAWTQPEHVSCWWDPCGLPLSDCQIDLRPGGTFRFLPQGSQHSEFAGVYREIVRPEKLVFEAMGSTGRVLLSAVGNKTRMTVSIDCDSALQLEQFIAMGVGTGTSKTLDNLVHYMGRAPGIS